MAKIETTIHEAIQAYHKLMELDPPNTPSKYTFTPEVRWDLTLCAKKLKGIKSDTEDTRIKLVRDSIPEGKSEIPKDSDAERTFQEAFEALLAKRITIKLHQISRDSLNLKVNNIPISLLSDLIGTVVEAPSEEVDNVEDIPKAA